VAVYLLRGGVKRLYITSRFAGPGFCCPYRANTQLEVQLYRACRLQLQNDRRICHRHNLYTKLTNILFLTVMMLTCGQDVHRTLTADIQQRPNTGRYAAWSDRFRWLACTWSVWSSGRAIYLKLSGGIRHVMSVWQVARFNFPSVSLLLFLPSVPSIVVILYRTS
jgi:hypothetical protein